MMSNFNMNSDLLGEFQKSLKKYNPQGVVGVSPHCFAKKNLLAHQKGLIQSGPTCCLPQRKLTRSEVRRICRSSQCSELYGFLCVMAWGGGPHYYISQILQQWPKLQQKLVLLKTTKLSRSNAYDLFAGSNKIKGLGPAFFTKLIYFFSPDPVDCYIMDQWTAKSINLLFNLKIIKMNGHYVSSDNKSGNYQAFCEQIDYLANQFSLSGEEIEERLFSRGGRNPALWRVKVKRHWANKHLRYAAKQLHNLFPHIPIQDFA